MKVPCRAAAWTISSPSGALTVRPSSVNSTTPVTVPPPLRAARSARATAHRVSHRDRRGLAEAADRGLLHREQPLVDLLPRHRRAAVLELLAEMVERAISDPAGRALLAGLLGEEAHRLGEQAERGVAGGEDLERGRPDAGAVLAKTVAGRAARRSPTAEGSRSPRRRARSRRPRPRSRPRTPRRARAS